MYRFDPKLLILPEKGRHIVFPRCQKGFSEPVDGLFAQIEALVEQSGLYTEKSKDFWRNGFKTLRKMFNVGPWVIWTPLVGFLSWFLPSLSIMPFGGLGIRHWTSKNSVFAAQNLMLAAVAKGYDTCPMEGFNPQKIVSLLNLPYGSVSPVVIAFGKRRNNARIDPQWRRPFKDAVTIH